MWFFFFSWLEEKTQETNNSGDPSEEIYSYLAHLCHLLLKPLSVCLTLRKCDHLSILIRSHLPKLNHFLAWNEEISFPLSSSVLTIKRWDKTPNNPEVQIPAARIFVLLSLSVYSKKHKKFINKKHFSNTLVKTWTRWLQQIQEISAIGLRCFLMTTDFCLMQTRI